MSAGRNWFKLDTDYFDNPKIIGLPPPAIALHIGLMCYCAQQLTDGVIPMRVVTHLATSRLPVGRQWRVSSYRVLVERELLHEHGDPVEAVELHGWLDMNPQLERAVVEKNRAKARDRVRRHRDQM